MSLRNVTIGVLPIAWRVEGETFGGGLGMCSFLSRALLSPYFVSFRGVVCGSTIPKSQGFCEHPSRSGKGAAPASREILSIEHCSTGVLLARQSPASVSQMDKIGKVVHIMSGAREKSQRREKRVNPSRHKSGAYQLDAS